MDRAIGRARAAVGEALGRAQRFARFPLRHVGEQRIAHDGREFAPVMSIPLGDEHHAGRLADALHDVVFGGLSEVHAEDAGHCLPGPSKLQLVRQCIGQLLVRHGDAAQTHAAAAEFGFDESMLFLQLRYRIDLAGQARRCLGHALHETRIRSSRRRRIELGSTRLEPGGELFTPCRALRPDEVVLPQLPHHLLEDPRRPGSEHLDGEAVALDLRVLTICDSFKELVQLFERIIRPQHVLVEPGDHEILGVSLRGSPVEHLPGENRWQGKLLA